MNSKGVVFINSCEITASVTALANIIAKDLDDDNLALLAAIFVQLGDTIATIVATRAACEVKKIE